MGKVSIFYLVLNINLIFLLFLFFLGSLLCCLQYNKGDKLSGLIVDVFDSTVVVQSSAIWIELNKNIIENALVDVMGADVKLIWRQSMSRLKQDGFEEMQGSDGMEIDDNEQRMEGAHSRQFVPIVVVENDIKYEILPEDGQKTGFYCDQRDNRQFVKSVSNGKEVLDTYCYSGGFSISAALGGAKRVVAIDSSAAAISSALENLKLNNAPIQVINQICFHHSDPLFHSIPFHSIPFLFFFFFFFFFNDFP